MNRTTSSRSRCRLSLAVVSGVALAGLTACGGSQSGDTGPVVTRPSASSTTAGTGPGTSASSTPQGTPSRSVQSLLQAGATAEQAVAGSVLISIETEAGDRWEAQVVTEDGVEHELDLSASGGDVVSGPRSDQEDAADRAEHRQQVRAARVDYRQAAQRVVAEVAGGRITELNLDDHRGALVWEADVIAGSDERRAVKIDARTGRVVVNTPGGD